MKLVAFDAGGGRRAGIVEGDGIIDLALAGAEEASIEAVVRQGNAGLRALAKLSGRTSAHYALAEVKLLAPLMRPGKFLGIGMNYRKHIAEAAKLGFEAPKRQLWFNKQTSCIIGPSDGIVKPDVSDQIDYEVELGVIIGGPAKHVPADRAREYVFGYTVVNDVSTRDWQAHSSTFTLGKSFDTHGPIGPWIVTADEIADCQNLNIRCLVNNIVRQSSNTSEMIHSVDQQIAYLSTAFTLEPEICWRQERRRALVWLWTHRPF